MKKLVADEISVLRQENTERDNKFQATLEKIAESIKGVSDCLTTIEGMAPTSDSDAASSASPDPTTPPKPTAPLNPTASPLNPSGQPRLAGKGILNKDGVLQHGPNLLPKKPFDEVLNLKTTHSSLSSNQLDDVVSRYVKLEFPLYDGTDNTLRSILPSPASKACRCFRPATYQGEYPR
jgi:hypothetical protein